MLIPNRRVSFRRPGSGLDPISVSAQVYPISGRPHLAAYADEYQFAVCLPPRRFSDRTEIATNDEILTDVLGVDDEGTPRAATLLRVSSVGIIPKREFVFKGFDR